MLGAISGSGRVVRSVPTADAPTAPSSLERKAGAALSNDDFEGAIKTLGGPYSRMREGPRKNRAALMLAVAYFNLRHVKEARGYIRQLLDLEPEKEVAREIMKALDAQSKP
jgi:Flp pilus assembly protein TadD